MTTHNGWTNYETWNTMLHLEDADWVDADTVQMIKRCPWESQGLVDYLGEHEDASQWMDYLDAYDIEVVSRRVMGWGDYAAIVKLTDADTSLYYLVTADTLEALDL